MPRSLPDRVFGFRSQGIIRILVAADSEEVLLAFDALDLAIIDKPGLANVLSSLVEFFVVPVGIVVGFAEDLKEGAEATRGVIDDIKFQLDNVRLALDDHSHARVADAHRRVTAILAAIVGIPGHLDKAEADAIRVKIELEQQKEAFRRKLGEAAEEISAGATTATI